MKASTIRTSAGAVPYECLQEGEGLAVKIPRPLYRVLEFVGPLSLRLMMHSARISVECAPGALGALGRRVNCIYAFWHGTLLVPAYLCRHWRIRIMISLARDGEYITRIINRMGFETVRGSSSRGSFGALEALAREAQAGEAIAITPDGPRGPRHVFQPGAVYLSQLSGAPIVPAGVAIRRSWKMLSWDRFEIPKPFTRVHVVIGNPIRVDRDFPRKKAPELAERLQSVMRNLTRQAADFLGVPLDREEA